MKKHRCSLLPAAFALGVFLASVIPTQAATIIVPTSLATTDGNSNSNTFTISQPRTSQSQIAASQLAGINIGDSITGISFRIDSFMTFSPQIDLNQLRITLAQAANTMANFGTNVAANMTNPVLVLSRSVLTLPGGYFPATAPVGSPNAFSAPIVFTNPYTYAGGDLILLVSHTQAFDTIYLDSASSATPGYGTLFRTSRADIAESPTLTILNSSFIISRFQVTPSVPEPSTVVLLCSGIALCVRRRSLRTQ